MGQLDICQAAPLITGRVPLVCLVAAVKMFQKGAATRKYEQKSNISFGFRRSYTLLYARFSQNSGKGLSDGRCPADALLDAHFQFT